MFDPGATYRVQFHKDFTLEDLSGVIPYLKKLGIGTLYASPVFEAVPGSLHGYDAVDVLRINPEIGTPEQLQKVSHMLRQAGTGWLQDIVPNHMAYHPRNKWLMDVLEKGPLSRYRNHFDQGFSSGFFKLPLMVPFLGAPLLRVIQQGELSVGYRDHRLFFRYGQHEWPLRLESYQLFFPELKGRIREILELENAEAFAEAMDRFRAQLPAASGIASRLKKINQDQNALQQLADQQFYRLCSWKETRHHINYRRFFTIDGLIAVNMQRPEVFRQFHALIASLLREGVFQGLRVDHVDGLYDARRYLEDLRRLAGPDTYIIVEKILGPAEELPPWPVQGSTGYDFMTLVNHLLTRPESADRLRSFYRSLVPDDPEPALQREQKKAFILRQQLSGELDNLTSLFLHAALADKDELKGIPVTKLREAIGLFMVRCPVYKFYADRFPPEGAERTAVSGILDSMGRGDHSLQRAAGVLRVALLEKPAADEDYRHRALDFYRRLMQFTGVLMAKGVEDTLMYTQNCFISHNEVGDGGETFGMEVPDFHAKMKRRRERLPLSLNATSTHDTKRGEDARARLDVLSDLDEEWVEAVQRWQKMNLECKTQGMPDANDEYFIYQALMGALPMPGQEEGGFGERFAAYLEKALREAKVHSTWVRPHKAYERATKKFASSLLDKKRPFWQDFQHLHRKVADFGIVNSLIQLLLKFTCPGVPDVFQGNGDWNFCFVDPDNRRPVDYKRLGRLLDEVGEAGEEKAAALWESRFDGRIKLWLTRLLFQERGKNRDYFTQADYIPVRVAGACSSQIISFARRRQGSWYLVAAPLHAALLCQAQGKDILQLDWQDTRLLLPEGMPQRFDDLLRAKAGTAADALPADRLFKTIPLALLRFA